MRKVILALGTSIDGYIARPDGTFDFLFMPEDFSMAAFFASINALIMGRKTYEVSKAAGEAGFGKHITNYVLSRTLTPGEREGMVFVNMQPKALLEEISRRQGDGSGKDIWLMGGGEVARDFLKADLVDEIHIGVVPVLLGAGILLFPSGFPQRDFELLENKTFSRGLVSVKYKRAR